MSPPSSSASSQDPEQVDGSPRPTAHKWNHFEVRTLICLIIKGEHLESEDPMHVADKLNMALNTGSARNKPRYDRDIHHAEVHYMLNRILSKKMHAVNVAERGVRTTITRTKLNAFMRNLAFDRSKEEWASGRKDMMEVEGQKRQRRYMARKEGAVMSPRDRDERHRRKAMIREPRARRLLQGWGIGASFWKRNTMGANRPRTTRSKSRESSSSGAALNPATNGRIAYITDRPSDPSTGNEASAYAARRDGATDPFNPTAMTPNPAIAAWGGQFAPASVPGPVPLTPLSTSIMPAQTVPASRYGFGGAAGFHAGLQQPYQSTGRINEDAWGRLPNTGVDQQRPPTGYM